MADAPPITTTGQPTRCRRLVKKKKKASGGPF